MNVQNKIIKGKDNPVVIAFLFGGVFAKDGLGNFSRIKIELGGESYSSDENPENIWVESPNELRINIGATTTLSAGFYLPTITGYSPVYVNGIELVGTVNKIVGTSQIWVEE